MVKESIASIKEQREKRCHGQLRGTIELVEFYGVCTHQLQEGLE